jgi:hypothetical protein
MNKQYTFFTSLPPEIIAIIKLLQGVRTGGVIHGKGQHDIIKAVNMAEKVKLEEI